jgi:serine/threonine protein kinase
MKILFQDLIKNLKEIRQRIKKKRFLLDESQEKFGLVDFKQLSEVKNEKEIKGYPFYGKNKKGTEIGIKIVPVEKKYNKKNHPAMLECIFLRELTDNIINKNISPHIVYYLGYQKVSNNCKSLKFLNLKKFEIEDYIRSSSNMLISEYIQGGSLDNWIYTSYENKEKISDNQWKILVFQLIYTLYVFQKYYKLMHNDCHYGNILIDNTIEPKGHFIYKVKDKKFYIPNTGVICKLWDFEFSMSYNKKI